MAGGMAWRQASASRRQHQQRAYDDAATITNAAWRQQTAGMAA